MYYTMKQLIRKFHRSKETIRICLNRYGISKIFKNKIAYYDISQENYKKMEYFFIYRKEIKYLQK